MYQSNTTPTLYDAQIKLFLMILQNNLNMKQNLNVIILYNYYLKYFSVMSL
jgi:hypothetical protein